MSPLERSSERDDAKPLVAFEHFVTQGPALGAYLPTRKLLFLFSFQAKTRPFSGVLLRFS